jgi:hypothetical protein
VLMAQAPARTSRLVISPRLRETGTSVVSVKSLPISTDYTLFLHGVSSIIGNSTDMGNLPVSDT